MIAPKTPFPSLLDFNGIMGNLGGISDYLPEMKQLLQTWGLTLDQWQQAAYSALVNQFTRSSDGFGAQDPQGIFDEFQLPPDCRLIANKWQHAADRYTKVGLCRMLAICGHTAVRIYVESNHFNSADILAGDLIFDSNKIAFNAIPAGQPAAMDRRYNPIDSPTGCYSVVIWDMTDATMVNTVGTFKVGANLGRNPDGKPSWAHVPKGDEILIKQICEYHECAGEVCLEVFYAYPNTFNGNPSSIDSNLEPITVYDRCSVASSHLSTWLTAVE